MPSGRQVTASVFCDGGYTDCFMRIAVYALSVDRNISEGLCGNYNDDPSDDLGLPPPPYPPEPVEFAKSFL